MTDTCTILSHRTAMRYWLSIDPDAPGAAQKYHGNPLPRSSFESAAEIVDDSLNAALQHRPVEVLVGKPQNAWQHSDAICHVRRCPLPHRSFYKLASSLYTVSPEYNFVQLASVLTTAQLVEYGMRLCAHYFIDPFYDAVVARSTPVTTPAKLKAFIKRTERLKGAQAAEAATKYVVAGMESPMEIKTELLLCLPMRLGGYGLPRPLANKPLLPGKLAPIVNKSYYRPDLSWQEQRVIVEYDGKDSHPNIHRDKQRINDLEAMGWKVVTITKTDLYDAAAFDKLVAKIALCLGKRVRKQPQWNLRSSLLREDLGLDWKQIS